MRKHAFAWWMTYAIVSGLAIGLMVPVGHFGTLIIAIALLAIFNTVILQLLRHHGIL